MSSNDTFTAGVIVVWVTAFEGCTENASFDAGRLGAVMVNPVLVADRENDRVQVFQPDGTFVKEGFYAKNTLGAGSAWDIACR